MPSPRDSVQRTRSQVMQAMALAEAMHSLTLCRDAEHLKETMLDGLVGGLGFERAALWELNGRRSHLHLAGSRGFPYPLPKEVPLHGPHQDPALTLVVREQRQLTHPLDAAPLVHVYRRAPVPPSSYALLPFTLPREFRRRRLRETRDAAPPLSGVLLVEPLSRIGDVVLATFLNTAALIAEKIFRNLYLEDLSRRDGLTGLWNRREMMAALTRLAWQARHGEPLGILFCDIDHFKRINDTLGHDVGDHVLETVARSIDRSVRVDDFVGRIGGEELLVLLPRSSPEKLRAVGERIRRQVEALRFERAPELRVTLSIGGALFPLHARTCRMLLRAADEALYQAKRTGRNRVVLYGEG